MNVLVLLSLVALCYSQSTFIGRRIKVGSDGDIAIVGEREKEIHIQKNKEDPRKVDVTLKSPYGPNWKTEINETDTIHKVDFSLSDSKLFPNWRDFKSLGKDFTQHDILVHLFKDYEGSIDSDKYEKLLEKIRHLVQFGVLHPALLDILRYYDFSLQYHQRVFDYQKYVPDQEEYGLRHYGDQRSDKMSPTELLDHLFQEHKYNQAFYPQQNLYQQYQPEDQAWNQKYQHQYEQYQHPYDQYQHPYDQYQHRSEKYQTNPLKKYFYNLNEQRTLKDYPLVYQPGFYRQQEYYQQDPQSSSFRPWWNPQQRYNYQQYTPYDQYTSYYKQFVPRQFNMEHQGFYGRVPTVY